MSLVVTDNERSHVFDYMMHDIVPRHCITFATVALYKSTYIIYHSLYLDVMSIWCKSAKLINQIITVDLYEWRLIPVTMHGIIPQKVIIKWLNYFTLRALTTCTTYVT